MKRNRKSGQKPVQDTGELAGQQSMDHAQDDEFAGRYHEQVTKRTQNIAAGDKVIMTSRYEVPNEIIGRIWTVMSDPKYKNGKRYVALDGYNGDYPVDGLKVVG